MPLDADAGVGIRPEATALLADTGIPRNQLRRGNSFSSGNGVTRITYFDEVESIAFGNDGRLSRGWS